MKCPHCQVTIHDNCVATSPVVCGRFNWSLLYFTCPACAQPIIRVQQSSTRGLEFYPAFPNRPVLRPVPPEVPDPYRQDFLESCEVLTLSPKASAALSRRNLQALLRERANTQKRDLADQIEEVIASGRVPSHIQEGLDAVRNIGNFAAHTIKSTSTGEIVEVELGEAEWNLDVLESLFDFYFVQPALTAKRRAALDAKLKDANKPPLK